MTTTTFTVLVTITDSDAAPDMPCRPSDVVDYVKGCIECSPLVAAHHVTAYRGDLTHLNCAADWGGFTTDRDRLRADRIDHAFMRQPRT